MHNNRADKSISKARNKITTVKTQITALENRCKIKIVNAKKLLKNQRNSKMIDIKSQHRLSENIIGFFLLYKTQ